MSNDTDMMSSASEIPFDPLTQTFSILLTDGITSVDISLSDVDSFGYYNSKVCANLGAQLGASCIMLVIILLITKDNKRNTLVFGLNALSLVLSIIRTILNIAYWAGPFSEAYAYFSGDYANIPRSAYNTSIAAAVFVLLFIIAVESSLLLQTHIIFKGLQHPVRHTIMMAFSLALVLLTVGFRFASVVTNIQTILDTESSYDIVWVASATLITETVTVWYFCLIFMGKLIYHIMRQRQMNAVVYKPLQILSIMSGCTMIIPSAFAILEYFPNQTFPEAGSIGFTLVAIMLPLSSAWAAASLDNLKPISLDSSDSHNAKLQSYSTGHTGLHGSAYDRKESIVMTHLSQATASTAEHELVVSRAMPMGRNKKTSTLSSEDWIPDLEGSGISVERTYNVHSGPRGVGQYK